MDNHNTLPPVITIDGASGTGKGEVTRRMAAKLGWHMLDSGVLYRALGLAATQHQIALDDGSALAALAGKLDLYFEEAPDHHPIRILLENIDVTDVIRLETTGNMASKVGAISAVRTALLERQRAFRQWPGLVTDGRDMGTVIFPDANCKIFLTASAAERARRRYLQLKQQGVSGNLGDLAREIAERDSRDQSRAIAPLQPAVDAICIDTDTLTIEEVVAHVLRVWHSCS